MSGEIEWTAGQYSSHHGSLGGIRIWSINWKVMRESKDWVLGCELPGLTSSRVECDTLDEAKERAQRQLEAWLRKIGVARV